MDLKQIIKWLLFILFLFSIYYFSIKENTTGSLTFLGLFLVCFFYLFANIKSVKSGGVEIQLQELNNSIKELRELSKTMAKISLDTIQSKSRMGNGDKKNEQEFFNEIDKILDNVNIPQNEKQEIYDNYWHKWVIWDYFSRIRDLIRENLTKNNEDWWAFDTNFRKDSEFNKFENHNPEFLNRILSWTETNTSKEYDWTNVQQHISEFEYYMQNKNFKYFNRWLELNKD